MEIANIPNSKEMNPKTIMSLQKKGVMLRQISINKDSFIPLRNSFIRKSMDYFIFVGKKSEKPFNSIGETTRKFDITYSHGIKLISSWEKMGLLNRIKLKPNSRTRKVVLTEKGERIRTAFLNIQEILKDAEKTFPEILKKIKERKN